MRIPCPFCGPREASEFAYRGDATVTRPPFEVSSEIAMYEYVYLRDNPAGPHEEYWYHSAGCRAWLRVRRDTRTHLVLAAELAAGVAR